MSEAKFTKSGLNIKTSRNASINMVTHTVGNGRMSLSEGIANAYLFSAAPEMYELLEDLSMGQEYYSKDSIDKLLAKARGES